MNDKREKYIKLMSQLHEGRKVIHRDRIKTITKIVKCRHQGTEGLSCDCCIGYIGLDEDRPRCYSSGYSYFISLYEEDFFSKKEFEI